MFGLLSFALLFLLSLPPPMPADASVFRRIAPCADTASLSLSGKVYLDFQWSWALPSASDPSSSDKSDTVLRDDHNFDATACWLFCAQAASGAQGHYCDKSSPPASSAAFCEAPKISAVADRLRDRVPSTLLLSIAGSPRSPPKALAQS